MTSKKRFNRLKTVNPQTDSNDVLKQKVLDDVGDLFNETFTKINAVKERMVEMQQTKRITDDLLMIISTSLKKNNNRLVKKNHPKNLMKRNHLKNQQKMI